MFTSELIHITDMFTSYIFDMLRMCTRCQFIKMCKYIKCKDTIRICTRRLAAGTQYVLYVYIEYVLHVHVYTVFVLCMYRIRCAHRYTSSFWRRAMRTTRSESSKRSSSTSRPARFRVASTKVGASVSAVSYAFIDSAEDRPCVCGCVWVCVWVCVVWVWVSVWMCVGVCV